MDALQDSYRCEEEDNGEENQTPKTNPYENDTNMNLPHLNPSATTKIPGSPPEQESDPIAVEPAEINAAKTEPEPDPEIIPVAVESSEYLQPQTEPEPEPELMAVEAAENPEPESDPGSQLASKTEPLGSEEVSSDSISEDEQNPENSDKKLGNEDELEEHQPSKKQKSLSQMDPLEQETPSNKMVVSGSSKKKKKSKSNNVWTKPTSRKGKKKPKNNNNNNHIAPKSEDVVLITPMPRFPDKNDDSPDAKICLSKLYKAEKVELSEDRLSAGSCKGYRMVRATRGVTEGAWFFEIKVVHLGETGHTRLGWSTEKGDLQAPVGYDGNSFGYRDIDGSKIHKALREKYGEEGFKEGDVIGFYINLPDGNSYVPKPPHMVWYKGQKYVCAPDPKEDPPKIIPGSEISFFKNGICQGVAFKDLYGGRYFPAASMYTLPNQPNCVVKFNFGPDFECFPTDLDGRAAPSPMIEVPYHGVDYRVENDVLNEKKQ